MELIVDRMAKQIKDCTNNANTSTQGQLVNGQAECKTYIVILYTILYVARSSLCYHIALIAHWTDNVVVIVNFLMDTLSSDRYTACMIFKKKMIK